MRKQALLDLVASYNKKRSFFQRDDVRINILKQFLNTNLIKQLDLEENISFSNFVEYLQRKHSNPGTLFSQSYLLQEDDSAQLFNQFINAESASPRRTNTQNHTPPNHIQNTFLNEKTFLFQLPILDIPRNQVMILDGYVFDSHELQSYAENNLDSLYRNPHIQGLANKDFSPHAKEKIRQHPLLEQHARDLDYRLLAQTNNITPVTIDAVITMLQELFSRGVAGSAEARAAFFVHKGTLTPTQQQQLDDFIIEVPSRLGGLQRMKFSAAFLGGSEDGGCIKTCQIFLWQFVITLRPEAISLIPNAIRKMAYMNNLMIGGVPPAPTEESHPPAAESNEDLEHDFAMRLFAVLASIQALEVEQTRHAEVLNFLENRQRLMSLSAGNRSGSILIISSSSSSSSSSTNSDDETMDIVTQLSQRIR